MMHEPDESIPIIAAIRVETGVALDDALLIVSQTLRMEGIPLAGAIQRMMPAPRGHRCDADLLLLANGQSVTLPEERGEGARGCRLNIPAFEAATEVVRQHLAGNPALLIINRFGKREALGAGFRPAIAEAVERGIPILLGVPERNWEAFCGFIGMEVKELPPEAERILLWCRSVIRGRQAQSSR
jgi:hypothetical protein